MEWPPIWPDFHDSLIAAIRGLLQPLLRPRYAALTQDRLYVVEADRPIYPDVAVFRTNRPRSKASAGVLEADVPAVFELWREELREPMIQIIEPAAGNRLVTAIEVLSPDNKNAGTGRAAYLQKRDEYWNGGANLVEIDLLRAGQPTVRVAWEKLASLEHWRYLVAVSRQQPSLQEVYSFPLARPLPKVSVPLGLNDADVVLDLQAAFTRAWDEGPYLDLIDYSQPPSGELMPEELEWCRQHVVAVGLGDTGQIADPGATPPHE